MPVVRWKRPGLRPLDDFREFIEKREDSGLGIADSGRSVPR